MSKEIRQRRGLLSVSSEFQGCTIWLTGLPSAGKTTLSRGVEDVLLKRGIGCYVLDGDEVRKGMNSDLDFSDKGRNENIRRFAHMARLMADSGLVCIVSVISPFEDDRRKAREIHEEWNLEFVQVFVNCPLSVCIERDVKGLYAIAAGDCNRKVTGISAPYEIPTNPDIEVRTDILTLDQSVQIILDRICKKMVISEALDSGCNLVIDEVDLQWIQVLSEGWAEPLKSFMDENDYLQSLHFRSIERSGKRYSQSVPIVLSMTDKQKNRLGNEKKIRLIYNNKTYAILEGASI